MDTTPSTITHLGSLPLDSTRSNNTLPIEVYVHDLSFSIIPKPSPVVKSLRNLNRKALQAVQWTKKTLHQTSATSEISASTPTMQDVTNVGLNIFRNVSMTVKPGQVCLLLGSSGAGKTSLLNALSGRFDPDRTAMSGSIQYNGGKPSKYWKTGAVGYLDQDDHLQPYLTPRETLEFVASMHTATARLTPQMKETIDKVLGNLGLRGCADRRIGNASDGVQGDNGGSGGASVTNNGGGGQQGLSGGEKRRVSVAIQLLTDPSVLFCDEPTSGLDAYSSFELIKTLTTLAKEGGKTIIASIHQPRSEIFRLLAENDGQLVLLSLGNIVYSGPIVESLDWFVEAGAEPCPKDMNPFEYMLDMSAVDYSSERAEAETRKRRQHLIDAWAKHMQSEMPTAKHQHHQQDLDVSVVEEDEAVDTDTRGGGGVSQKQALAQQSGCLQLLRDAGNALRTTVIHSFLLSKRGLQSQYRDPAFIISYLVIHVIIGIWIGYIFYGVEVVSLALRARVSLSLAMAAFQPFLSMTAMVYRASNDVRIFDRERKDRWYGPAPYIASSVVKNIPMSCLGTIVYSTIVYYISGLRADSIYYYFMTMLTLAATQLTQCGYILISTTFSRGFPAASLISFAGFIVFCFKILVSIEFTDRQFECPYMRDGVPDTEKCEAFLGNVIISQFNSFPNYFPGPIAIFLIHMAAYMGIAWAILTIKVYEPSEPSTPGSVIDLLADIFISPFVSTKIITKEKSKSQETIQGSSNNDDEILSLQKTTIHHSEKEKDPISERLALAEFDTNSPVDATASEKARAVAASSSSSEDGATRIDMYNQRLDAREPVEIRVDGLQLSAESYQWQIFPRHQENGGQHRSKGFFFARWIQRQKKTKRLLQGITATFPSGELTAILGGSGAGKTSLLNLMLQRSPQNLKSAGDIWFNKHKNPSLRKVNSVCAYVRQDDSFLYSHLTVRETLQYAAELSMSPSLTRGEKYAKVESIMELMGLLECADVLVGSEDTKGCSGGQRRRVSIAIQLVLEPSCLVLDEPTTGLDAMTALALVRTLKAIAQSGRTVVCSIHQPRHDIWNEFDSVILLVSEGRLGYAGKRADALTFFEQNGFTLPEHTNPADFIIDVASINYQSPETEAATRQQVEKIAKAFAEYREQQHVVATGTDAEASSSQESAPKLQRRPPYYATFWRAFPVLTRRSFRNTFRQKSLFYNRISLPLMVSILSAFYYHFQDISPMGMIIRAGFIQQLMVVTYSGLLTGVCQFPMERDLAFHDLSNGLYGGTSFFMAYMANEFPLTIVGAGVMTILNRSIAAMFQWTPFETAIFFLVAITFVATGESLAIIIGSWTNNSAIVVNGGIAYVLVYSLMAGVVNPNMVKALVDLSYISLWRFGTIALTLIEASGLRVECTNDMIRRGLCPFTKGEEGLRYIRYSQYKLTDCLIAVVGLTFFYRFVAWAMLMARIKKQRWQ
ncbi:hypothetical protein BGW42_000915 [Actinomortierella wolfii]|nr:hypothetical protein BGW42_000915 [Actinomortierella wolfii]